METEKILVGIVDDHTLFRKGLISLMSEHKELEFVYEADNGQLMKTSLPTSPVLPDILLMDIKMPEMDGYQTAHWLKDTYPKIKVLALTTFGDYRSVIKMMRCGAKGFMPKEATSDALFAAIKSIHINGLYFNEKVSPQVMRSVKKDTEPFITPREIIFLRHCCSELTYKEIADKMCVGVRAIDNYRESLFKKLNMKNRSGLVVYAIQNGIFIFD